MNLSLISSLAFSLFIALIPAHAVASGNLSEGCGAPVEAGGSRTESVVINGITRTYQLVSPAQYDPKSPMPLVVGFHHSGGTTADAERYGIIGASNEEKAVYILPQGLVRQGRTGWNEQCGGDDMLFVTELMKRIEKRFCIDTSRRFAYGFSWGGDMSNTVGCCLGSQFRAIAPESGGVIGTDMRSCQKPVPAFMLQSGADDQAYGQAAFANVVKAYQTVQNCQKEVVTDGNSCLAYKGCANAVIWCSFPGLAHALEPDSGKRIWTFFSKFQ